MNFSQVLCNNFFLHFFTLFINPKNLNYKMYSHGYDWKSLPLFDCKDYFWYYNCAHTMLLVDTKANNYMHRWVLKRLALPAACLKCHACTTGNIHAPHHLPCSCQFVLMQISRIYGNVDNFIHVTNFYRKMICFECQLWVTQNKGIDNMATYTSVNKEISHCVTSHTK